MELANWLLEPLPIYATLMAMIIHANKNMFRYLGAFHCPVDWAMAGLAASAALPAVALIRIQLV